MRSSLLFVIATGCSLGNITPVACTGGADCKDAFGFGMQCGTTGYCEPLEPSNRCDAPYPEDLFTRPEDHPDILVIGTLFDVSAAMTNLQSIELAIDEANIEGGLDGRELGVINCNYALDLELDGNDSETAAKLLTTWLADVVEVPVIVGPGSSPRVQQIWPEAQSSGVLLIAPSATSDVLTTIDGEISTDEAPGLFWRTAPPDSLQAAAIAQDITLRGKLSIAMIHETGAYGQGLADALDGQLALTPFPFSNSNELTSAIADVGAAGFDEVVFASSQPLDVSSFLNGAQATGSYLTKGIFLTDTARDVDVLLDAAVAIPLFPNVRGSVPVPDPTITATLEDTFFIAYSQRYGDDPSQDGFNTFSYDAAWLALYGLSWAKSRDAELVGIEIARGLRKLADPTGPSVPIRATSWNTVQDAFADGTAIDVFGASGTLDFDPETGETKNPIALWTLEDPGGGFQFVDEQICFDDGTCIPAL